MNILNILIAIKKTIKLMDFLFKFCYREIGFTKENTIIQRNIRYKKISHYFQQR